MTAEHVWTGITVVLLVTGTGLMALGAVGVVRMPDLFTRVQAASKTSTLGLTLMFLGVALSFTDLGAITQAAAVIGFAFLSVPLAAHMITRAAHATGSTLGSTGGRDDLRQAFRKD